MNVPADLHDAETKRNETKRSEAKTFGPMPPHRIRHIAWKSRNGALRSRPQARRQKRIRGMPCVLLSAARVQETAYTVPGRRAHGVERPAAHRLRLLLAIVRARRALHQRGGPSVRRKQRRRAAARGERARQRENGGERRAANPMHRASRRCLTAYHENPRWPLLF